MSLADKYKNMSLHSRRNISKETFPKETFPKKHYSLLPPHSSLHENLKQKI